MIKRFIDEMDRVEKLAFKKIFFRGLVNSFSQAVPFLAYAVALTYGGFMVANGEIHYKNIVRYVFSLEKSVNNVQCKELTVCYVLIVLVIKSFIRNLVCCF